MAMSFMIRRASHTVVPLAIRAVASPRTLFLSGSTTNALKEMTFFPPQQQFCTDAKNLADPQLVKSAKLEKRVKMPEAPADFPFKIEDKPGENKIDLSRKIPGERLSIWAHMPRCIFEEGSNGTSCTHPEEGSDAPSIKLFVLIMKENWKRLHFVAYLSADDVKIESVSMHHHEEPEDYPNYGMFRVEPKSDLQSNLKEYLNMRGIKETYFGFLYEYMVNKSKRDRMNF